jgi:hypothetical protein
MVQRARVPSSAHPTAPTCTSCHVIYSCMHAPIVTSVPFVSDCLIAVEGSRSTLYHSSTTTIALCAPHTSSPLPPRHPTPRGPLLLLPHITHHPAHPPFTMLPRSAPSAPRPILTFHNSSRPHLPRQAKPRHCINVVLVLGKRSHRCLTQTQTPTQCIRSTRCSTDGPNAPMQATLRWGR